VAQDELTSIACSGASTCTAVGLATSTEEQIIPLAERWNGATWEEQAPPKPAGSIGSELLSVSCLASTCFATGYSENSKGVHSTLAERWEAGTWTVQSTPTKGTSAELDSVSCASGTECVAGGWYVSGSPAKDFPLAERWTGTEWKTTTPAKLPSGDEEQVFEGMSCPAAKACTAVGTYFGKIIGLQPLSETWNGTSWTFHQPSNPEHALESAFRGVSCSSAAACTAVGKFNDTETKATEALIERWNGSSWTVEASESPTGKPASEQGPEWELEGVSCPTATSCFSTGTYVERKGGRALLLSEHWNGTAWQLALPVDRSGVERDHLPAISCSAETVCTAVGYSEAKSPVIETLAERIEQL
jgi:hypothetical protein